MDCRGEVAIIRTHAGGMGPGNWDAPRRPCRPLLLDGTRAAECPNQKRRALFYACKAREAIGYGMTPLRWASALARHFDYVARIEFRPSTPEGVDRGRVP